MAKGFSPPPVHFSSHHFLTLSIFAYTKFYTRPAGLETAALELVGYERLPGASAFAAMDKAVNGVKIFGLADFRHTVSPSLTV